MAIQIPSIPDATFVALPTMWNGVAEVESVGATTSNGTSIPIASAVYAHPKLTVTFVSAPVAASSNQITGTATF